MMLVKDKSRDIAIMRTMGATQGAVMRVFLITGASIGVVGTIAGLILGLLICWNIDPIYNFVSYILGREPFDPNIYFLSRLAGQDGSMGNILRRPDGTGAVNPGNHLPHPGKRPAQIRWRRLRYE